MDGALAAVRVPVLAIQSTTRNAELKRSMLKAGDSSPYLDLLKQALKNLRIEVVPGVGHFTQLEASSEVNRLLATFVAGCKS
jgi:pimeloyl-ACP methyl ester carboxylesterase